MAPHFQSMRYELHTLTDVDANFGLPTNKSHMALHSLTCPHSHHLYSPLFTTHSVIVQVMPDSGNRNGECAPHRCYRDRQSVGSMSF